MSAITRHDEWGLVPLYYQLKRIIQEKIENEELKPGDRLPSEREIAEEYGISRMTVRQGITELVRLGLLYRKQGKGTFVAEPKIEQGMINLTSFTEDMTQRGLVPGARVIDARCVQATKKIAGFLKLGVDKRVIRIERLRLANGEPMALEISHIPYQVGPSLVDEELNSQSLYGLLEKRFGVRLASARQSVEPVLANEYEARLLGVEEGSPLLLIERITCTAAGEPVEYVKSVYRGDKYKFYVDLVRR